jgi:hypothetical protein
MDCWHDNSSSWKNITKNLWVLQYACRRAQGPDVVKGSFGNGPDSPLIRQTGGLGSFSVIKVIGETWQT